MPNLGGWEFVILIGILVLLFGAKRLPDMARSIGQSARVFKGEMKGMKSDDSGAKPAEPSTAAGEPTALPPAQQQQQSSAAPSVSTPVDPQQSPRVAQPGHGQPGQ